MNFSVSSYSYSKYQNEGHSLWEIIDIASKQGFDAIEFTNLPEIDGMTEIEIAKKAKEQCGGLGLAVSAYTVWADFLKGDAEKEAERLKRKLDVCAELGADKMRHDATWVKGLDFEEALPKVAKAAAEVADYAETLGIKTMTENHGMFFQDSDRMERLFKAVGRDNYGLLIDMGNFLCVDEDPVSAVERLKNYAIHVHAKDFYIHKGEIADPKGYYRTRHGNYLKGTVIGRGDVNVYKCLDILVKNGYDDYVTVEFEGDEDCLPAVKEGLEYLKKTAEKLTL